MPLPKITLLRDGKPLTPKDGIEQNFDAANHRLILNVKNARVDQSGLITCKVENPVGTAEASFKFDVTAAPVISKGLTDQECSIGKDLRLTITSSASPVPTIAWFRDSTELTSQAIKVNENTYELILTNVKIEDDGLYKVVVSNELGQTESQCKVTVTEPAEVQCQFPEQQTIGVGQEIRLQCQVSGRPVPDVVWTKDGKELKPSDRIEITKTEDGLSTLVVKNITPDDKVSVQYTFM